MNDGWLPYAAVIRWPSWYSPCIQRPALADAGALVGPRRTLDLIIHAQLVGGAEGGLRRAPGVEAQVIEPVCLADSNDPPPCRFVGRRVAGQREDAALQRPTQEDLAAVDRQLGAIDMHLAQPERGRLPIGVTLAIDYGVDVDAERIQRRVELIPQARLVPQRVICLHQRAAGVEVDLHDHRRRHMPGRRLGELGLES